MKLEILLSNKTMSMYEFGQNKKEAKAAAAIMALKNYEKNVFIINYINIVLFFSSIHNYQLHFKF